MDIRQDDLRGTLRFHCAQCWEQQRPRGVNHHWYKSNRADVERVKDRSQVSPGYFPWRTSVRLRDRNTCRLTGRMGGDGLATHHLWNFADHPGLREFVWNGASLSRFWHAEFHKEFGKSHNTLWQLQAFAHHHVLQIPFLHITSDAMFDVAGDVVSLETVKDGYARDHGRKRILIPASDLMESPESIAAILDR